ncbi:preprotein translocase subunit SecG [Aquicella lusitana]|mgnify:CR=1 FL=1|uniref:Protein-export membrane protein SecG n=1 Tax=Aquicella lusitana TaxID=254246 RepID=A0A370GUH2_9COXI|nr:preprotein translocase subunit SecG [Aquicella lusitana]RDI46930.1 protein translocase subunit secG [Aquicella lusitana]VVC73821.1 Protein-export membrane protein SecG [Aquicella lusitana]
MYQFIMLIHVFAAVFIIALVLVQQGKGATMGAAFGSGASQTVFGSRGSGSFLFRITIGLIAVFFITSIVLNNLAAHAYKQEKVITLPVAPARNTQEQIPVNNTSGQPAPVSPEQIPTKK